MAVICLYPSEQHRAGRMGQLAGRRRHWFLFYNCSESSQVPLVDGLPGVGRVVLIVYGVALLFLDKTLV